MQPEQSEIKSIGLVGVGLVGTAWASFYAAAGLHVRLCDLNETIARKSLQRAAEQIHFLAEHGMLPAGTAKEAIGRMEVAADLAGALRGVDVVHESAFERYDVKIDLYHAAEAHVAPHVPILSSTSALLMTRIQQGMKHPQRAVIAHPFNPAHLVPLVELVPGDQTDAKVVEHMRKWFNALGKTAVVLRKEVPGYLGNRFQAAVWREAIHLVLTGVASVADVDRALCAGPGIRWALMGQHLIYHLGGGEGGIEYFIKHIGKNKDKLWSDMASWTSLPPDTISALLDGLREETGGRSITELEAWRDEKLAAILRALAEKSE